MFARTAFGAGDDGLAFGAEMAAGVDVAVGEFELKPVVGLAAGELLEAEVGDAVVPPPAVASGAGDDVVRPGAALSSGAPQPARARAATPNSARVRLRSIKV